MEIWDNYLKWVVSVLLTFSVVPYVTAWISSKLGHLSKTMLVDGLGPNSQLFFGGLGVMIHEIGHAVFALLFGHRVTKLQLLNVHYANNGTLGSVQHTWRSNNAYQMLGNFFIGLAPYYTCSIVLYALQKFLLDKTIDFSSLLSMEDTLSVDSFKQLFQVVLNNFFDLFTGSSVLMIVIFIVLATMISSTGFDLSKEDFQTVQKGIIPWLAVLTIVSVIATVLGFTQQILTINIYVIVFSLLFLFESILFILISMVIIKVLSAI